MFEIISKELDINGNVCEIIDKHFEFTNKHRKSIGNEYDSQLDDYRDKDEEERNKYVNRRLRKLPMHEKLQNLYLNDVMMDFAATSLYPSAVWDEILVCPKKQTGFVFKPDTINIYVKAFNHQTFNQEANESAVSKIKYHNPPNFFFNIFLWKKNLKKRS